MLRKIKTFAYYAIPILLVLGFIVAGNVFVGETQTEQTETVSRKEQAVNEIMESDWFKKKVRQEAERIYYKRVKEEATSELLELQDGGFKGSKAENLQGFLESRGSPLAQYASEIVELPRWTEVVAIVGVETSFCTNGVGSSRDNCGAIKRGDGGFKRYEDKLSAVEDVAYLLQKDLYREKTISEMNGTYCVHEEAGGGKCPNWSSRAMAFIDEIHSL